MIHASRIHRSGGEPATSSLFRRAFELSRRAFAGGKQPDNPASQARVGRDDVPEQGRGDSPSEAVKAIGLRDSGEEIDVLDRALDADPDSAHAYAQMGALCERRGQVHAAYRWYKQALSLDSGCSQALDGVRRYCSLMGLDDGNPRLNPAAPARGVDS